MPPCCSAYLSTLNNNNNTTVATITTDMTKNMIITAPSGGSPSSSNQQTSFSTPHQSLNSTIRRAIPNNNSRNDDGSNCGKNSMPLPYSSCFKTKTSDRIAPRSIHRQSQRRRPSHSSRPRHHLSHSHRQLATAVSLALMTALSSSGIYGSSTVMCAADAKTIRGHRELVREGHEGSGPKDPVQRQPHEEAPSNQRRQQREAQRQLPEEEEVRLTMRKRPQRHHHQRKQQQKQDQPQQLPQEQQHQPPPPQLPARTLQEEEHNCPPNHSGWAPSSTCQSYFWCSAGVLSSLPYSCVDGLLYDHSQQTCVEASAVDCSAGHAILAGELETSSPVAPVPPTVSPVVTPPPTTSSPTLPPTPNPTSRPTNLTKEPTSAPTEPQPTPSPTDRPTSLGPPLYYVDYPSQTCLSSASSGVEHPTWLDELSLYRTKRECCTEHFGWTGDISGCLGPNWVETNVIWAPTASPTLRPSAGPTVSPTSSPTETPTPNPTDLPSAAPSEMPSEGPTEGPTAAPSGVPTIGPTTTGPTASPTTSAPTLAPFTSMPTFAGDGFDGGKGDSGNSMTQYSASANGGGATSISEAFDSQGLSQSQSQSQTQNQPQQQQQQQQQSHSTSGAEAAAAAIRDQYLVQLLGWANADIDVSAIEGGFSGWQYQYHQQSQFEFEFAPMTESPTPGPTALPTDPPTTPMVMEEQLQQYQISELILPVQGDATISAKRTSLNFGSHQALAVNSGENGPGDERFDSLLKFDIALLDLVSLSTSHSSASASTSTSANRKIEEAQLEIYVMESCNSGGTFTITPPSESSLWDASTVTWDNAPSASRGYPITTLGAVTAGQWYHIDMTSALTWYGQVLVEEEKSLNGGLGLGEEYLTVRMETEAEKRCLYSSMESGEALAPRLIVKFAEAVDEEVEEEGAMEEQSDSPSDGHQDQQDAEEQEEGSSPDPPVEYPPLPPPPPPVPGDFLLLRATDDATVIATSSTFNFGTQDKLVVAFDSFTRGIYDSLIKFDLREVQSVLPRSAVLSLFAEVDCTSAGMFTTTTSSGGSGMGVGDEWTEGDVTWANAPMGPVDGASGPGGADLGGSGNVGGMNIGTFGPVQGNNWYGFNVGDAVTEAIKNGKDTVTFRLSSGNMNPCQYTSREGGRAPKLMVSF